MTTDEKFMLRCLELARLGTGKVAPNPMVGAILVHEDRIIGEGYHQQYGGPHAEPNCFTSVKEEDRHLFPESTLYVSLEPCAHYGKTPPCADLIVQMKIPRVVIGCRDPFIEVDGKGMEKLNRAGIETQTGVLEEACKRTNKRFLTFHTQHRPYVVLKWAQSANNRIAAEDHGRVAISNEYTNRIVHKWRSEEMAIAIGTNTALFDDPELTTRWWPGTSPVRVVVDMNLRLPGSLKLFQPGTPTIVFNSKKHNLPLEQIPAGEIGMMRTGYYQVTEDVSLIPQMLNALYRMNIQSVLVEGGSHLLQSFIDEGTWDEARVITNEKLSIPDGLPAPVLRQAALENTETVFSDLIRIYRNTNMNP